MECGTCGFPSTPDDRFCGNCGAVVAPPQGTQCTGCGRPLAPEDVFCGSCGLAAPDAPPSRPQGQQSVVMHHISGSQIAIGDGNFQVQVNMDGSSQFGRVQGGVALQVRELPPLAPAVRPDLVGRHALVEQVAADLMRDKNVQLFGPPGVGRSAVAEAVLRRLSAARVRVAEIRPGAQPYTLASLYQRLVQVFFGSEWHQPEEAVLRLEVARAGLRALIVIIDCDLARDEIGRLLGSFPRCAFLLTSHRQTLSADVGAAYEVDPLTPDQARELLTRELGSDLAGRQNLQWQEAYRQTEGQVQRLIEHAAFIKRVSTRPGQTDLINLPIIEQVADLVAGLGEPARRVLLAMSTFGLALKPDVFAAVTGIPAAARAGGELLAAGLVTEEGPVFRIVPDAATIMARDDERSSPAVAADGLMPLLETADPPDAHLVLAVAKALQAKGNDAYTARLVRIAIPVAVAAGQVEVWFQLVALGAQAATRSRRQPDLAFFLKEQHTSALVRGDMAAAAAALAALGVLLGEQHHHAAQQAVHHASQHASRSAARGAAGRNSSHLVRQGRRLLGAGHGAGGVAVGVVLVAALVVGLHLTSGPAPGLGGFWSDSAGDIYNFTATGSGTYTAVQTVRATGGGDCTRPDDVKVTGSGNSYHGTIKLYPTNTVVACPSLSGTATITIQIAANGQGARVVLVANEACNDCGTATWTRGTPRPSPT
jgi:hypothetical protein